MDFKGLIIKESLKDDKVLSRLKILKTLSENVTPKHRTPWLTKWTYLTVQIEEDKIDEIIEKLKDFLDDTHEWYIDLANDRFEITIFHDNILKKRIFKYFK